MTLFVTPSTEPPGASLIPDWPGVRRIESARRAIESPFCKTRIRCRVGRAARARIWALSSPGLIQVMCTAPLSPPPFDPLSTHGASSGPHGVGRARHLDLLRSRG